MTESQSGRIDSILHLIASARPEQQRAIASVEPLVVVSAGAGTGKTHTLAMRFAWLLATNPDCRVEQILTLTFSEAASGEMRDRIRSTLQSWYQQEPRALGHLRDAIDRIDEAYISTIHSFALRVIRESGLNLDLDPASSIAPEPFKNAFWDEYRQMLDTVATDRLASLLEGEWISRARKWMDDEGFLELLNHFSPDTLTELAQKAGELFGSKGWNPEDLWHWREENDLQAKEQACALLRPYWDEAWDTWQSAFSQIADALESDTGTTSEGVRALYQKYNGHEDTPEARALLFIDAVLNALKNLPRGKDLKNDLSEALGEPPKSWRDDRVPVATLSRLLLQKPLFSGEEMRVRQFLLQSAAIGWQSWENARQLRSLLSFSDLIRYAGEALRSRDDRMGFLHLMVDEFQDTDALQNALLEALWKPGENTLFLVGDLKQSIYRFRHANLRLFARYIRRAQTQQGEHIPLNCSYRMNGPLIEYGNALFQNLWEKGVCSGENIPYDPLLAPVDAPMWPRRNPKEHESTPSLEALIAVHSAQIKPAPSAGQKREALYEALAERFVELKESQTPIWDKRLKDPSTGEMGAFRPAQWGDFCVLAPSRTSYAPLEDAFDRHGIPAVFLANQSYYSRGEVLDLVHVLNALENPTHPLPLAGWMASPFSGLPPHCAVQFLQKAHEEGLPLHEVLKREEPRTWGRLNALRRIALLDAPSSALSELLNEPLWLRAFSGDARRRAYANVRRGVQLVREYENAMGRTLAGCADYLASELKKSAVQEEPEVFDVDAQVVRVMTMHASKGLEFPIVALAGLEQLVNRPARSRSVASLHCGVTFSALPDFLIPKEDVPPTIVTSPLHAFLEKQEEIEERQRLFYVAVTRAQERVLLCGLAKEGEDGSVVAPGSMLEWFLESTLCDAQKVRYIAVTGEEEKRRHAEKITEKNKIKTLALPVMKDSPLSRLSASAYALLRWCPRAYRLRYRQGRELIWELPDGDGIGGADLGSLAHYILERWDFDPQTLNYWLPKDLDQEALEAKKRILPSFLRAEYHNNRSREALREWLLAFAAGDTARELRQQLEKRTLKRERPFRARCGESIFIGSIDLCWEADGLHIRDWKITPEQSAPQELYESQLLFYGGACHIMMPGKVRDIGLLYLRPNSTGPSLVHIAGIDWGAVVRDMHDAAQEATGELAPNRAHCSRCPWRNSCGVDKDEIVK